MRFTTLATAFTAIAMVAAQGVTDKLTPTAAAPAGCTGSVEGKFQLAVAEITKQKRELPKIEVRADDI